MAQSSLTVLPEGETAVGPVFPSGAAAGRGADMSRSAYRSVSQATMIGVLTLFGMLASIDKNFLTLVVASVRRDLQVTDVQIGLLIGLAFAVSNVTVAIPAGWLADRVDRRRLIAGAVGLWSLMAALCGAAGSFATLFAARVGVGLGEGLSPPASYSLLRDAVPPERHGRAFSIFSVGASVGAGLSFVVAGGVLGLVASLGIHSLPLVGEVHAWQAALVLIGLCGLPLVLLAFAFPEPGRVIDTSVGQIGYRATLRLMWSRRALMIPLLIYSVSLATLTSGWAAWAPAVIERGLHMTPQQIGPVLGLILMIGAPIGLIGGGQLMDRLSRNGAKIAAIASAAIMMVATALAPQTRSLGMFLVPQTLITLTSLMFLPVVSVLAARNMPSAALGKTIAIFLLLQGAVGTGFGPIFLALISDQFFAREPHALNQATTVAALILGCIALVGAIFIRTEKAAV